MLSRKQNPLNRCRFAIDDCEQDPCGSVGLTAALLPIPQGRGADAELLGKIILRQAELPPDLFDIDSRRHQNPMGASLGMVAFGVRYGVL